MAIKIEDNMNRHAAVTAILTFAMWSASPWVIAEESAEPSDEIRIASVGDNAGNAIVRESGVKGGLVVHLGCGDGKRTAALHVSDSYLVHGLDTDAGQLAEARSHIRSLGLYGKVSVEQWEGDQLPYANNLVRLLVAENLGKVPMKEVLRVLCPDGVAMVRGGGQWKKTVKPWPEEIDEWTHYLHDPSNNAVAADTVLGPPRRVQWIGGPRWTRDHHTLNSISSVVTAAGRLFFLLDESSGIAMKVPGKLVIVARDAFSGVELWRKPMKTWAPHTIRFRSGPPQLPRLLVASKRHVYVPLGWHGPVSQMDSQAGEVLKTYDASDGAEEILLEENRLLVLRSTPVGEPAKRRKAAAKSNPVERKSMVAIDVQSGRTLWEYAEFRGFPMPETLASDGESVCIQVDRSVVCLDLESGERRWSYGDVQSSNKAKKPPTGFGRHVLVISAGVVLCNLAEELTAISIEDGEKLWSCRGGQGFHAPMDLFVIDGIVWTGSHPEDSVSPPPVDDFSIGRVLRTGEVKHRNSVMVDLQSVGHHHRCYRNKAPRGTS